MSVIFSLYICPRNKKQHVEGNDQQKWACKGITPPSPAAFSNMAEKKPAILKIIQPYAQRFTLPLPMLELYNPEALHMGYLSLLKAFESAFQSILRLG